MITYSPPGSALIFFVREDTSDINTVISCCTPEDEYNLVQEDVDGKLCFDIGAHIGGVAISLAARGARVIAVEPVPDNAALVRENAELNNVAARVHVVEAAAGESGVRLVRYGYSGDENARHHAYIGGTFDVPDPRGHVAGATDCIEKTVPSISLTDLVYEFGCPDIMKIDCEGGEWAYLADPAARDIRLIVGEWHPINGEVQFDVAKLLDHAVEFTGPTGGPGGFTRRLEAA